MRTHALSLFRLDLSAEPRTEPASDVYAYDPASVIQVGVEISSGLHGGYGDAVVYIDTVQ